MKKDSATWQLVKSASLVGYFFSPSFLENKAKYTATLVACGWAGAVLEKVTRASGQEQYAQKAQKRQKSKKGTNRPTDQPTNRPMDRQTDGPT